MGRKAPGSKVLDQLIGACLQAKRNGVPAQAASVFGDSRTRPWLQEAAIYPGCLQHEMFNVTGNDGEEEKSKPRILSTHLSGNSVDPERSGKEGESDAQNYAVLVV